MGQLYFSCKGRPTVPKENRGVSPWAKKSTRVGMKTTKSAVSHQGNGNSNFTFDVLFGGDQEGKRKTWREIVSKKKKKRLMKTAAVGSAALAMLEEGQPKKGVRITFEKERAGRTPKENPHSTTISINPTGEEWVEWGSLGRRGWANEKS